MTCAAVLDQDADRSGLVLRSTVVWVIVWWCFLSLVSGASQRTSFSCLAKRSSDASPHALFRGGEAPGFTVIEAPEP